MGSGQILTEGVLSVGRAVAWFAVFAVFTSIPSIGRSLVLAMGLGITALLCNLLISGGIAQPSVAQPLWIVAALALPVTATVRFKGWLAGLALAGSAFLALIFGLAVYEPLWRVDALVAEARRHYGDDGLPGWYNQVKVRWQAALESQNPRLIDPAYRESAKYLKDFIIKPLEQAAEIAPGDAKLRSELALWYEEQWNLLPEIDELGKKAVDMARKVQVLDPDSVEGWRMESTLQLRRADRTPKNADEFRRDAVHALQEAIKRDPTEASLHYELAEVLFTLKEEDAGKKEAARALELNNLSTTVGRKLADPKVETLRQWLGKSPLH